MVLTKLLMDEDGDEMGEIEVARRSELSRGPLAEF